MAYKTAAQKVKSEKKSVHVDKDASVTSINISHTRAGMVMVSTSGKTLPVVNPIRRNK